jgi:iron(III) transport system substrate-binding protein
MRIMTDQFCSLIQLGPSFAPHPSAAVLMFDFMLSDAQKILADRDYVAVVGSPLDRDKLTVMDSAAVLAQGDKWERLYNQILSSRR